MRTIVLLLGVALACPAQADQTLQVALEATAAGSEFGDDATVYVFRDVLENAKVLPTPVFVDGIERTSLTDYTFTRLRVTPGEHVLEFKGRWPGTNPAVGGTIPIEGGRTYWFVYGVTREQQYVQTVITASLRQIDQAGAGERLRTYGERYNADTQPAPEDPAAAAARMPEWQRKVMERVALHRPPGLKATSECQIRAKFAGNGRLLNLGWIKKCEDSGVGRSIINAFKQGSPFPAPPEPEQAKAGIVFTFADEPPPPATP